MTVNSVVGMGQYERAKRDHLKVLQLFLSCFHLAALKFALHQEFETFNKLLGAISSNYAWFDSDDPPSLRDISSGMSEKNSKYGHFTCK